MVETHYTLETRSLEDFISRMYRGTFFYIFSWFMLSIIFEFYAIYPKIFWIMSIFQIITTLFRLSICKNAQQKIFTETKKYKHLAILAVSLSAMQWGLFYAFILADPKLENALLVLTMVTGIIAAASSAILSIYSLATMFSQTLILMPAILVITQQYFFSDVSNRAHLSLGIALIAAFFYLRQVYTTTRTNYINAIQNQLLAESHAKKMEYFSIRDPLTKLKNRLYFDSYLEKSWIEAKENNSMISLMIIDLDYFKKINDTYGHLVGDECLRVISRRLKKNLHKEGDHLARFGGEEFILCLQQSTPQGALIIAERLLQCVKETEFIVKDEKVELSCSIGLASVTPDDSNNVDDLLIQTDTALYAAKENGRDQLSISTPKEITFQVDRLNSVK